MFGKKIVISDPPYTATPLLLKQLKNNQNQTNTTGAQNLKEFNNRAGWLSVFFFVMINQVVTRRIRYYNFFPKHSFLFFYYHKMNLLYSFIISKILVYIFNSFFIDKPLKFNRKRLSHKLCYISGIFDNLLR
jgi:hypothetical protein